MSRISTWGSGLWTQDLFYHISWLLTSQVAWADLVGFACLSFLICELKIIPLWLPFRAWRIDFPGCPSITWPRFLGMVYKSLNETHSVLSQGMGSLEKQQTGKRGTHLFAWALNPWSYQRGDKGIIKVCENSTAMQVPKNRGACVAQS